MMGIIAGSGALFSLTLLTVSIPLLHPPAIPDFITIPDYCDYRDTLLRSMTKRGKTPLGWPEKSAKKTITMWPVARRRGLQPVLTTLFSIHSKEAIIVLKHRRPPQWVLNHFFRCRGFAKEQSLDGRLIDGILAAAEHFRAPRVEIISAFRSSKFNDTLSKKGRNVSKESKHTRGEAIDFFIPDVQPTDLGEWLWEQFDGGVGTYAMDGFVHIDVGPKRRWFGK